MPVQIRRLLLVFTVFIGLMLLAMHYLTPDSWGLYGHYRAKALTEIADKQAKYVQMETCAMCHDSIAEFKSQGNHKPLQCEVCHGPGYKHVDDPENIKMEIPQGRQLCLRCHTKNAATPKGVINQIDPAEHYSEEDCITCHNPHQP
jgi:hypothetical protein